MCPPKEALPPFFRYMHRNGYAQAPLFVFYHDDELPHCYIAIEILVSKGLEIPLTLGPSHLLKGNAFNASVYVYTADACSH